MQTVILHGRTINHRHFQARGEYAGADNLSTLSIENASKKLKAATVP